MQQPFEQGQPYPGPPGFGAPPTPEPGFFDAIGPEWMPVFIALGAVVTVLVLLAIYRSLVHIARPNEALVFSGLKVTLADGTTQATRADFPMITSKVCKETWSELALPPKRGTNKRCNPLGCKAKENLSRW